MCVDVGVVAVALVRQLLHRAESLYITACRSRGRSGTHRWRASASIRPNQLAAVGGPDVEVAVGGQDHAIDAALNGSSSRATLVGQAECRLAPPLVEPPALSSLEGDSRIAALSLPEGRAAAPCPAAPA